MNLSCDFGIRHFRLINETLTIMDIMKIDCLPREDSGRGDWFTKTAHTSHHLGDEAISRALQDPQTTRFNYQLDFSKFIISNIWTDWTTFRNESSRQQRIFLLSRDFSYPLRLSSRVLVLCHPIFNSKESRVFWSDRHYHDQDALCRQCLSSRYATELQTTSPF